MIANIVKQFWTDTIWDDVDYLFVDMPPGTGDVPLTVFQSIPVDGIVIVTSPQELVSMIVAKAVNMAKMMNIPILGIVENMSFVKCPDCGKEIKVFGESHLDETARKIWAYRAWTFAARPRRSRKNATQDTPKRLKRRGWKTLPERLPNCRRKTNRVRKTGGHDAPRFLLSSLGTSEPQKLSRLHVVDAAVRNAQRRNDWKRKEREVLKNVNVLRHTHSMRKSRHFMQFPRKVDRSVAREKAGDFEAHRFYGFSSSNQRIAAAAGFQLFHSGEHVVVIVADHNQVVRIVPHRGGRRAVFQTEAFHRADADSARTVMPLNDGNFQDIVRRSEKAVLRREAEASASPSQAAPEQCR